MNIIYKVFVLSFVFLFCGFESVLADTTAPATPRGFYAHGGGESGYDLILTWINPADADLDHIEIYWGTSGGYYSPVSKTVMATPNTKGQYSIVNVASGTDYYVSLKAVDNAGNKSAPTTELKRTLASTPDTSSPDAVSAFSASDAKTDGLVVLNWTNSASEDFFQVIIYRDMQDDFAFSDQNRITTVFGSPSSSGVFTDTRLTNGQKYYYKIRAEDNKGNIQTGLFYPSAFATPTLVVSPVVEPPVEEVVPVQEEPVISTVGIIDGDLLRTAGTKDIYIIKIVGVKKFKRLILNPEIFNSYGHLKWENVKDVEQGVMDAFIVSDLIVEVNSDGVVYDPKVYKVNSAIGSDTGEKHWLNMTGVQFESAGYDWDAIYQVNHKEASDDFYPQSSIITAY